MTMLPPIGAAIGNSDLAAITLSETALANRMLPASIKLAATSHTVRAPAHWLTATSARVPAACTCSMFDAASSDGLLTLWAAVAASTTPAVPANPARQANTTPHRLRPKPAIT